MNDTHGVQGEGWVGFDLDGTLAVYDKWEGIDHIGEPVKPMVDLIKKLRADGKVVKILTARVAPRENPELLGNLDAKFFITRWCEKHLGFVPEITHEKDHLMLELYDDRVKQVIPNKGVLVEDEAKDLFRVVIKQGDLCKDVIKHNRELVSENIILFEETQRKWNGFGFGAVLGLLLVVLTSVIGGCLADRNKTPQQEALDHLHQAIHEVQSNLK